MSKTYLKLMNLKRFNIRKTGKVIPKTNKKWHGISVTKSLGSSVIMERVAFVISIVKINTSLI